MQINVLEYLQSSVKKFPNGIAISELNRSVTYSELWSIAAKLATKLPHVQNGNSAPIAVYLPKSIDSIVSFVAILLSGNFYCPIDVKSPLERTLTILSNLSPVAVVTSRKLAPKLAEAGWSLERLIVIEDSNTNVTTGFNIPSRIDTDPIYVIYTSGSTGVPKGVTISHRGVIDYIDWAKTVYPINESDIIGSQAPLFFDNSTLDIYLAFASGARLDLIPEDLFSFPVRLVEYLSHHKISFIFWVPSVLTLVANADALKGREIMSLNYVLFAGEAMPARTLNYWRRHLPEALFSNLYGPTEITVDCTYYIVDRDISDDELVPIGWPCRNSEVIVLGEDNCQVLDEEIGELCVRGSSLALGYWNSPEKTNASFVQNPLRPEYRDLIYRTGDLVRRNRLGELIFIGRKDSQIKHHGYRIELGEIEAAASSIDELKSVCVLYNQKKGEITLFYESITEISFRELRDKLGRILPKYMMPGAAYWRDKLPINANGKIDRIALASMLSTTQCDRA